MDQIKIGKFIAERRKALNLTQSALSEKLCVTDRAISKWETGKAMPDSAIMLALCDILKISVNDLLSGEIVSVENYNKEAEKNLVKIVKEKEKNDKLLLKLELIIGIYSIIILFVPIIIGAYIPMETYKRFLVIFSGFIPAIVGFCFALKIEQVAGYYECKNCGHRYVPSYKAVKLAPHMGRTRYLKCPKCEKKTWQKKVITKEPTAEKK